MKILRLLLLWALCATPVFAQSGYHNCSGTDLDSVFAPEQSGWPRAAATGYHVSGGSDINTRYAPLSFGTAAGATCNHIAGGADLNTVFAALGSTAVAITTQPSAISGSAAAGYPSGTVTSNTTSCAASHGNSAAYSYSWHIASGSATPTAASAATSAVTNSAVPAATTLTGTWYCTATDGITSANSNTVAWSLQNTTPNHWTYSGTIDIANPGGNFFGYSSGGTFGMFGSLSPTTINGNVIENLFTNTGSTTTVFSVIVSPDPGQSIFTSLTSSTVTLTSASATYTYSGAVATWSWNTDLYGVTGPTFVTIN